MKKLVTQFLQEEKGATAIEYGLIAGLIAVAIIAVVTDIGADLARIFGVIQTKLASIGI